MYNELNVSFTGFTGVIYILALSWIFGILMALCINTNRNSANLMINLSKPVSIILFLIPFKRKVVLEAVVLQICNYSTLIAATMAFKMSTWDVFLIERICKFVVAFYLSAVILLLVTDMLIYDLKRS